jgi:glutaminyl-peptide cyclotransferase
VLETLPHDTTAYTQGFEIRDGILWESTGLYGSSTLRRLDPEDGSILDIYPLPDTLFGEGLTVVGDSIYQLTWRAGLVLKWNTSAPVLGVAGTIDTDGWGICSVNGSTVVTSDGTSILSFRDIDTFDTLSTIEVTMNGSALSQLNELEYHEGCIWANRYYSDFIYRIDPETGRVTALVDATELRLMLNSFTPGVMNGIAWDPEREAWLLTGKNWPLIFVVELF